MNTINLMGRLCNEPELKTTNSGVNVCSFTLAVDRAYTPKGQEKVTDFIPCVAWKTKAEFLANYFHKGDRLALVGSLQTRKYTDKNGNERTAYEVIGDEMFFCESRKKASDPMEDFVKQNEGFIEVVDDEELPF